MIQSLGQVDDPAGVMRAKLHNRQEGCFYFHFEHKQHHLDGQIEPIGILFLHGNEHMNITLSSNIPAMEQAVEQFSADAPVQAYHAICNKLGCSDIDLLAPLRLDPIHIPKPWGQEIWFSAIERRGVCTIKGIPISWLLDVCPDQLGQNLILLKILDPLPDERFGDLYFEVHDKKTEVYVVTQIDPAAWPDGQGQLRYGFNEEKIRSYPDFSQFKAAYLNAVQQYRITRQEIDDLFDQNRQFLGIEPGQPLAPDIQKKWYSELDDSLREQESANRQAMDDFTQLHMISVGDVIQVLPGTPHALQHGVRVVEFQTAHYERLILSFTQKVITQEHWDTEAALVKISQNHTAPVVRQEATASGLIADLESFTVHKLIVDAHTEQIIAPGPVKLLIVVSGTVQLQGRPISAEDSYLLPAVERPMLIGNNHDRPAVLLVAQQHM